MFSIELTKQLKRNILNEIASVEAEEREKEGLSMENFALIGTFILIFAVFGAIFYNSLRRNWYGVLGVGGSYFIVIGLMLLVSLLATWFGKGEVGMARAEMITMIVIMIAALGYMVFLILVRCKSVKQKIFLPVVALLMGFGFAIRLMMALVLRIPMGDGKPAASVFPKIVYDPQGEQYRLQNNSGDHATYYCQKSGQSVQFRDVDFEDGLPGGWYTK